MKRCLFLLSSWLLPILSDSTNDKAPPVSWLISQYSLFPLSTLPFFHTSILPSIHPAISAIFPSSFDLFTNPFVGGWIQGKKGWTDGCLFHPFVYPSLFPSFLFPSPTLQTNHLFSSFLSHPPSFFIPSPFLFALSFQRGLPR